jgi:hypothetical protein
MARIWQLMVAGQLGQDVPEHLRAATRTTALDAYKYASGKPHDSLQQTASLIRMCQNTCGGDVQ